MQLASSVVHVTPYALHTAVGNNDNRSFLTVDYHSIRSASFAANPPSVQLDVAIPTSARLAAVCGRTSNLFNVVFASVHEMELVKDALESAAVPSKLRRRADQGTPLRPSRKVSQAVMGGVSASAGAQPQTLSVELPQTPAELNNSPGRTELATRTQPGDHGSVRRKAAQSPPRLDDHGPVPTAAIGSPSARSTPAGQDQDAASTEATQAPPPAVSSVEVEVASPPTLHREASPTLAVPAPTLQASTTTGCAKPSQPPVTRRYGAARRSTRGGTTKRPQRCPRPRLALKKQTQRDASSQEEPSPAPARPRSSRSERRRVVVRKSRGRSPKAPPPLSRTAPSPLQRAATPVSTSSGSPVLKACVASPARDPRRQRRAYDARKPSRTRRAAQLARGLLALEEHANSEDSDAHSDDHSDVEAVAELPRRALQPKRKPQAVVSFLNGYELKKLEPLLQSATQGMLASLDDVIEFQRSAIEVAADRVVSAFSDERQEAAGRIASSERERMRLIHDKASALQQEAQSHLTRLRGCRKRAHAAVVEGQERIKSLASAFCDSISCEADDAADAMMQEVVATAKAHIGAIRQRITKRARKSIASLKSSNPFGGAALTLQALSRLPLDG